MGDSTFTLGDFVILEIALAQLFKDLDLSMAAGQQVQQLVGKIELEIGKIQVVAGSSSGPAATHADLAGPKA